MAQMGRPVSCHGGQNGLRAVAAHVAAAWWRPGGAQLGATCIKARGAVRVANP